MILISLSISFKQNWINFRDSALLVLREADYIQVIVTCVIFHFFCKFRFYRCLNLLLVHPNLLKMKSEWSEDGSVYLVGYKSEYCFIRPAHFVLLDVAMVLLW